MEDRPLILPPQKSEAEVLRLLERYPLPLDKETGKPFVFDYGTAGFRYQASIMESLFVRVGILAAHRSASLGGAAVGVMVTASHNDESYNGVKLADPNGGMMDPEGEVLAVELANAATAQDVLSLVSAAASSNNAADGVVHVGRDTRSHSPALTQLTIRAAQAMGATVYMHGVVTTPILHYCVMMAHPLLAPLIPRRPNVVGYYDQIAYAYMGLLAGLQDGADTASIENTPMVVDCACGVGYAHTQRLNDTLQKLGASRQLVARNAPGDGPLNEGCGSEHVQKNILPPQWYSADDGGGGYAAAIPYAASLDGDSDRIVFFSQNNGSSNNQFTLLDGDKIAVLICDFLQEQVSALEKALSTLNGPMKSSLNLGVIQTAYANGASTQYLQRVLGKDRVKIAKTGVKHVHKAAHDYFDVGVYFEANGHGTVLFGDAFYAFLADADRHGARGHIALQRLQLLPALVNQAVGDALSDLLLVDAILQIKSWTIEDWNGLYVDLPSRQCKVKVEDRTVIQTNENETRCTSPMQLQDALDAAIATVNSGNNVSLSRCFVRPSGTENVVRVYAEAPTPQQADELATQAAKLVFEICAGVGEPPVFPSSKM